MKIISLVLFIASFVGVALAGEWNCADTSGTFELSTDCTMTDEVDVSGDLTVTGNETVYSTLIAASSKRHFKITSGAHTLRLKWLNMTGGNIGTCNSCWGGSIYAQNVAAHLNISHCVFFNNHAQYGGAVFAKNGQPTLFFFSVLFESNSASSGAGGGGVYLRIGTFYGELNTFKKNTAGMGGGVYIEYSVVSHTHSSFRKNTAEDRGGGIYIVGGSSAPSQLKLTRVELIENIQTGEGTDASRGGGGLFLNQKVTANVRECTFVQNEATESTGGDKHGHQIMTQTVGSDIPSITIVNTNFTNLGDHPFYGYEASGSADRFVSPTTCASNPCTASSFNGNCEDRSNTKYGVICGVTECPTGEFRNARVTESLLPPPNPPSCSAWSSCTAGEYVSSNGTNITDRVCAPCGTGEYSATANEDSCTPWANCTSGQYISTNGTSSTNRGCSPCDTGKYSTYANAFSCTAWSSCVAGQKIAANGTGSADRTCEACPTGQFSTSSNHNTCVNWTVCNATTEVESSAGSATADRVCELSFLTHMATHAQVS
jgi:predicted outer membrane repeat protein